MVALFSELWFNSSMLKTQAINLLGGSPSDAAAAMGISYQAVNKWPNELPDRIADRVLGVCVRRGIQVPAEFMEAKHPMALTQQAETPLTTDPVLAADLNKAEQAGLVTLPKKPAVWDGVERRHLVRRAVDREHLDIGNAGQGV